MIKPQMGYLILEKIDPADNIAPFWARVHAIYQDYSGELCIGDLVSYANGSELGEYPEYEVGVNLVHCKLEDIVCVIK